MATIEDVARLAGVSRGTVSNVINGKVAVRMEKVRRVTEVMDSLRYQPNAQARSLKSNTSQQIAVILPNIEDPHFASIFSSVERVLRLHGFVPSLLVSSEIPMRECEIISQVLGLKMAGLILVTCQPHKIEYLQTISRNMPTVFVDRSIDDDNLNFVGSDFQVLFTREISKELAAGKKVGLISGPEGYKNESEAESVFLETCYSKSHGVYECASCQSVLDKQAGFQAAVRLLNQQSDIQIIFTTSELIAEGTQAALELLYQDQHTMPTVRSFTAKTWDKELLPKGTIMFKPSREIGESAAEILLSHINDSAFTDTQRRVFAFTIEGGVGPRSPSLNKTRNLRVLLMEGDASKSVRQLIGNFTRECGIRVDIDTLHFSELHKVITESKGKDGYDVLPVDIPWIPELVHKERLMVLDPLIRKHQYSLGHFLPGVIEQYSQYQGTHYGVPFQFGTQLLFYRKDLFDSQRIKHHFYEWHKTDLKPPQNWMEFNAIARFFTRKFNADSPTLYGTTLGAGNHSGAVCEYLPRQWSYNGNTFNSDGSLGIDSWESIKALDSYTEGFQYAQDNAAHHWWDEQVDVFCYGDAAMMVMFALHAAPLADQGFSKVIGKVGYDMVPGGKPLLGGWSLGISSDSDEPENAFRFIQWITSARMAIPFTILGGLTPSLSLFRSSDLLTVYPWLPKAQDSFEISTKRVLPEYAIRKGITEDNFECILGESIYDAVQGLKTSKEALASAKERIELRLAE